MIHAKRLKDMVEIYYIIDPIDFFQTLWDFKELTIHSDAC